MDRVFPALVRRQILQPRCNFGVLQVPVGMRAGRLVRDLSTLRPLCALSVSALSFVLSAFRSFEKKRSYLGISHPLCSPIADAMKLILQLRRSLLSYLLLISSLSFVPVLAAPQNRQPTIHFVRNPDPAPDFNLTPLDATAVTLPASNATAILLNFST